MEWRRAIGSQSRGEDDAEGVVADGETAVESAAVKRIERDAVTRVGPACGIPLKTDRFS